MKERILLPSSRYIMGFQNKEERLIQRAYNDFFYLIYDNNSIEDKHLFQRGFCKALTSILFQEDLLDNEIDFQEIIQKHFPENTDEFVIEEVEIKFRDEDLILLQLFFIHQFSMDTISQRTELSAEDAKAKIEQLKELWGNNQEMSLEEYLLQIEKRQWFKRLANNPIPLKPTGKKSKTTMKVGEINKVETSLWEKVKGFFS